MANLLVVFFSSYIMGSISPTYIMGKFMFGKDMCQEGSGNLGAMNSFRVGGLFFGLSVLILDFAKGAGTILWIQSTFDQKVLMYLGALGIVLGHNFSLYLNFRGGKGLAALAGILIVLDYRILIAMILIGALFLLVSRSSSVAAISSMIFYPFVFFIISQDWRSLPFMSILSLIILKKHRPEEYVALTNFLHFQKN